MDFHLNGQADKMRKKYVYHKFKRKEKEAAKNVAKSEKHVSTFL